MAQPTQSFQFNNVVKFGLVEDYSNTLATSAFAQPFNEFDSNPRDGTSMRITYPVQLKGAAGLTYTDADSIVQRYRYITLNSGFRVPISFDATENTFLDSADSQSAFSGMYISPMVRALGQLVNAATMDELMMNATDTIGSPTSQLNGITSISLINNMIANMGLTQWKRKYLQLSPNATTGLQVPYTGYFNEGFNASILANDTTTFDKSYSGLMPYIDQSYITITNGVLDSVANTVVVSVAPSLTQSINDSYSTVTVTGLPTSTTGLLLRGNRIWWTKDTSATVIQQLNPKNYQTFGNPKYFVIVSTSVDSSGGGSATFNMFPPVVSNVLDPYQNVSSPLEVGDRLHVFGPVAGQYVLNFVFTEQSLKFANPNISTIPGGNGMSSMGGFPFQQMMREKITNSQLTVGFNLAAQGDIKLFTNSLVARTISGAAAFNGTCFAVASSM